MRLALRHTRKRLAFESLIKLSDASGPRPPALSTQTAMLPRLHRMPDLY
jgi:hypothetical protein